MNLGIGFYSPEEYFLGETARDFTHSFKPADHLIEDSSPTTPLSSDPPFDPSTEQEILVFCGSPGAGKSTFFRRYLQPLGYGRVNQDLLKTRPKCVAAAKEFLKEGKSVAIGAFLFHDLYLTVLNADADCLVSQITQTRTLLREKFGLLWQKT